MEPTPSQPQRKFAHRHAAILLTISAGLLITATVFAQIAALERRSLKQTFLRQVDQHMNTWTSMIQDRLSVIDSVCRAIREFRRC